MGVAGFVKPKFKYGKNKKAVLTDIFNFFISFQYYVYAYF